MHIYTTLFLAYKADYIGYTVEKVRNNTMMIIRNMLEHYLSRLKMDRADYVLAIIDLEKEMNATQNADEYCTYLSQWYKLKYDLGMCKTEIEKCRNALRKLKGE